MSGRYIMGESSLCDSRETPLKRERGGCGFGRVARRNGLWSLRTRKALNVRMLQWRANEMYFGVRIVVGVRGI